jgi:hypothetical protein
MARYRIHRIRETPKEQFRWAAHTGGLAIVKPRDYDSGGEVEAVTPYAAWKDLAARNEPLHPGDVLEAIHEDGSPGELRIAKYIGFEPAQWHVPELKTAPLPDTVNTESQIA